MARAKRNKPHHPAKVHDRRSRDLPRNAEVAAVEVDDPFGLEPGDKIVTLRSIRNDPLRPAAHASSDRRGAMPGRAGIPERLGESRAWTSGCRSNQGICRWRAAAGADHGRSAQGCAAAEPRRARTRRRRLGAGARGFDPWHDHGADRAAAGGVRPALDRLFRAAIPRVPGSAGFDLWVCDGAAVSVPVC
jgi:hypothetical protein